MNCDSKQRNRNYSQFYGISLADYNKLFETQAGRCAICSRHQTEFKRRLFVDHNHQTKKVRGLLCVRCNSLLGAIEDTIFVKRAQEYLNLYV